MADPTSFDSVGAAADSKENAQWWLLFAVLVANKPAEITTRKLNDLLSGYDARTWSPFDIIASLAATGSPGSSHLTTALKQVRTGQYTRVEAAFTDMVVKTPEIAGDDPREWSLPLIESIPGIGPKSARWFYLLCHPAAKVAALDTHVLKFLRDQGIAAPKTTPPAGKKYKTLEMLFVEYADRLGIQPRDLDFMVWAVYRNQGNIKFKRGRR